MAAWWRRTARQDQGVDAWITQEFAVRGLTPPHCTPEALARVLERERQITIMFRPHPSEDPGVYGLLYRPPGHPETYIIFFRPTPNLALRRLIVFHELAHLVFRHPLRDVGEVGVLRGALVTDEEEAYAEAFAVGAMQYSFQDPEASRARTQAEDHGAMSVFGQLLTRTEYRP